MEKEKDKKCYTNRELGRREEKTKCQSTIPVITKSHQINFQIAETLMRITKLGQEKKRKKSYTIRELGPREEKQSELASSKSPFPTIPAITTFSTFLPRLQVEV